MRSRSLLFLALTLLGSLAACANSNHINDKGTGGAPTTTAESSTVASTGTVGGGGDGGGTIGPCSESPCKLTGPQCGCPAKEQCSVSTTSADPTFRLCVAEGIQNEGQKCTATGAGCAPGLICVGKSPTVDTCATFCASDADCKAPGGLCILTLNDGKGGTIPNAALCSENCNPITSTECVAGTACRLDSGVEPVFGTGGGGGAGGAGGAAGGTGGAGVGGGGGMMGVVRSYTACGGTGVGTQNSTCKGNIDCGPGYGCFTNAANKLICAHYCKVGGTDCLGGTTCNAIKVGGVPVDIGGIPYGACL